MNFKLRQAITNVTKVYLVWHQAADAFSGGAKLERIFSTKEAALEYGIEHYPGYGPRARDFYVSERPVYD
jgi:hypothetical protein